MFLDIGGDDNPDIRTYRERSRSINRDVFFREVVWAIWGAGKSRIANESFLNRAIQQGFVYDFRAIASWNNKQQDQFLNDLHGWTTVSGRPHTRQVPQGAINRWNTIFYIAKLLVECSTEQTFSNRLFGGKIESVSLDVSDVHRLVALKLPYLKEVTAQFLIKNIGGESIKEDRWINEFLDYYGLSKNELEQLLVKANIAFGLFDTVLWCYCEEFIPSIKALKQYFDSKLKFE